MRKKTIIILSLILSIVAVVLILFWTLFALSSVTVEFSSSSINLNVSEEEIVEAGQFRYGACVLFEGKKKSVQNIYDKAKENPNFAYMKVVNIETVFPNKFVIHVAEREELFAFEKSGQTYFCDRDFRVLRSQDGGYLSTPSNAILLEGLQVENPQIGDFLDVQPAALKALHSAFLKNNRDYSMQIAKFEKIVLSTYQDENDVPFFSLIFTTFQGSVLEIKNPDFALSNKVQLLCAAESALLSLTTNEYGEFLSQDGEKFWLYADEEGRLLPYDQKAQEEGREKFCLSAPMLENLKIVVDNLTFSDYVTRSESDIFYYFQTIV